MRHPDGSGDRARRRDLAASQPSSLGEALAWLDRHVDLEKIERGVAGRAAAPTLDRVRRLLHVSGDPQTAFPLIHVTGTNGKGSTTRLASSLLVAQGLSVGTYTSPHLERLNERLAHDGEPIGDVDLADELRALAAVEAFVLDREGWDIPPTWFELVTALAYRWFADEGVEAAVIEVGMGGRYDATNVADGAVAVVTNVELDHVGILGSTREAIASEKSGIVKAGSVLVLGERDPSVASVFVDEARAVGAREVWRRDESFSCTANRSAYGGRLLDLRTPGGSYDEVYLPLFGAHQGDNAAAALAAVEAFLGAPLGGDVVADGFAAATVPGRLEVVGRRPLVLLDGAHNPAGAAALGAALADDFAAVRHVVAVVGCLAGRDARELIASLGPERLDVVVACTPPSPRAQPAAQVAAAAQALGVVSVTSETLDDALEDALGRAGEDDLVLVTGSLYLVGAARAVLPRLGCRRP